MTPWPPRFLFSSDAPKGCSRDNINIALGASSNTGRSQSVIGDPYVAVGYRSSKYRKDEGKTRFVFKNNKRLDDIERKLDILLKYIDREDLIEEIHTPYSIIEFKDFPEDVLEKVYETSKKYTPKEYVRTIGSDDRFELKCPFCYDRICFQGMFVYIKDVKNVENTKIENDTENKQINYYLAHADCVDILESNDYFRGVSLNGVSCDFEILGRYLVKNNQD